MPERSWEPSLLALKQIKDLARCSGRSLKNHVHELFDVYVQQSSGKPTRLNPAIRSTERIVDQERVNTFRDQRLASRQTDFILAHVPLNIRLWGYEPLQKNRGARSAYYLCQLEILSSLAVLCLCPLLKSSSL